MKNKSVSAGHRCSATTARGTRCQMPTLRGTSLCFAHSPSTATARKQAAAKGGRRAQVPKATTVEPYRNVARIHDLVDEVIADVRRQSNTSKRAALLLRAAQRALELISAGQLEHRMDEIEDLLRERGITR